MYSFIKGKVIEANKYLVLENGGIGYKLLCSAFSMQKFVVGEDATVFTEMVVNDSGTTLYGFEGTMERDMFNNLISVSGVGPKGAIGILSSAPLYTLASLIASRNHVEIAKFKGIGKKTAERLVLELKEKVEKVEGQEIVLATTSEKNLPHIEDAIFGLVALGINKTEAARLAKENVADTAEQIIFNVLKSR